MQRFLQKLAARYKRAPVVVRLFLAALALCVVIAGAYWGRYVVARHIATSITVTATCTQINDVCPAGGVVVFHHTYGPLLAQDAQWLLTFETSSPSFRNQSSIMDGGLNLHYHLAFTFLGLPVETADVIAESIPEYWTVSSPGMAQPSSRVAWDSSIMREIANGSGGSIPSPSDPNWKPVAK